MKTPQARMALAGVVCLITGGLLTFYSSRRYTEKRYIANAAACQMNLMEVGRKDLQGRREAGSVVLFHGISANEVIMQYLARSFAELGLRVFVPDLPGHGRSPGPFGPEQVESCALSLVRGLTANGMLTPGRTILAGHSMGGAIALRIAPQARPAAVIAISPAPMQEGRGVIRENLLFHGLPRAVPNTLVMAGQFEPRGIRENAAGLKNLSNDIPVQFDRVPGNTHVSMLFSPTVARESQDWAVRALSLEPPSRLPSRANLFGSLIGLLGILLLAGPCLRDLVGKEPPTDLAEGLRVANWRGILEIIVLSLMTVQVLQSWQPLGFIRLFQGGYLASFFLCVGAGLVLLHLRELQSQFAVRPVLLVGAAAGGLLLQFLVSSWFELTATSAWMTWQRWARFPLFFLAALLFLCGLELLAGPGEKAKLRYGFWLGLVVLAWLALAFGVLYLKSAQFLLVLLSPYFALQFLLAGLGIQLVRRLTGSAAAAAVFGAILLAGFCVVLFPLS